MFTSKEIVAEKPPEPGHPPPGFGSKADSDDVQAESRFCLNVLWENVLSQ